MRAYRLGKLWLRQFAGIPIGGPISGAILDATLSSLEFRFRKWGWKQAFLGNSGFHSLDEIITISRYVDDLLLLPHWVCPCCCESIIRSIYATHITFDKACDSQGIVGHSNVVKFLDLFVHTGWIHTLFCLYTKKDLYVYVGFNNEHINNRFPVPCHSQKQHVIRLSSDWKSRIAKIKQHKLTRDGAYIVLTFDIVELHRLDYRHIELVRSWTLACRDSL